MTASEHLQAAQASLIRAVRALPLPLAAGEENGSDGFPLWALYLRADGSLVVEGPSLPSDPTSLSELPLWALAALAESPLSGEALLRDLAAESSPLRRFLPSEAAEDAETWALARGEPIPPTPSADTLPTPFSEANP